MVIDHNTSTIIGIGCEVTMAVFSRFIPNFNSLFTTQCTCTVHVQLTNRGLITTVCILIRFECYQNPKGKRTTIIDTVTVL